MKMKSPSPRSVTCSLLSLLFLVPNNNICDAFHTPVLLKPYTTRTTTTTTKTGSHLFLQPLGGGTTATQSKTPAPVYPTTRGETVDSRKIISSSSTGIEAVRLSHILFASKELAALSFKELKKATLTFEDLAGQISNCEITRGDGGLLKGWVGVKETGGGEEEYLDSVLPAESRREVLGITTKPGDIVMTKSSRGYHLVQILDIMVNVRKMANIHERKFDRQQSPAKSKIGILGGALDDPGNSKTLFYRMETMGCQMNIADSERMEGQLQSLGIMPLPMAGEEGEVMSGSMKRKRKREQPDPDVVILNTCSIRDHAEQKVYSYVGPYAKLKREGKDITIIVAGCVAQQEGQSLLRRIPEIDLVMGPQYANRLSDLLEDVSLGNQVVATEASHIMEDSTKPRRSSSTCAWVNVIYGCNERCTYCIVPTTRGVEQSRPPESILSEVSSLVSKGYKEVTLLGQNIDAYGRDMAPKRKFSDLIRAVGAVEGLKRIRFVTSHPRYMSLGVVDAVAETDAACESFHVPFQSGNNEVLQAMGRGHTREKYLEIIDRIRLKLPDASITADVIVGFPGETDEQFEETLDLMRTVKFDSVNTAAYSPRPNTPAAIWTNQLDEETKQLRLRAINELNLIHAKERRSRMMGRTVEVLIEERNVKVPTQVMGRTTHGYIVYTEGDVDELRGKSVMVEILETKAYYLSGKTIEVLDA